MSRRPFILVLALAFVLPGPAAVAQPSALSLAVEPADQPWWRRARWRPQATVVLGMPIKRLHPEWCAAEAFRRQNLDAAVGAAAVDAALAGRQLRLDGSFDGRGVPQTAFVGAYRRCGGERGLFLAIVEPAGDRVRMRFLVEVPEPGSGLAMLAREPDGTLAVWWCADCDDGNRISFNRELREFYVAGPATRRR
jgi:hypothetical protein